jgi:hypothetical protein
MLIASDVRDNPGAGLAIRARASPRIGHSAFVRNGTSEHSPASVIIEPGAAPLFQGNVFQGPTPNAFIALGEHPLQTMTRDNWFVGPPEKGPSSPRASGPRPAR